MGIPATKRKNEGVSLALKIVSIYPVPRCDDESITLIGLLWAEMVPCLFCAHHISGLHIQFFHIYFVISVFILIFAAESNIIGL